MSETTAAVLSASCRMHWAGCGGAGCTRACCPGARLRLCPVAPAALAPGALASGGGLRNCSEKAGQ
eukprot:4974888-Alexandrium_andersonii.AAC.1